MSISAPHDFYEMALSRGKHARSEGLVMAVTEGEIEGKCLSGRRRTAWMDDVRRWTVTEGEIEGKCLPQ